MVSMMESSSESADQLDPVPYANDQQDRLANYKICFLNKSERCLPEEIAIIIFILIALLFLYQMLFVWMYSFRYSMLKERRLQIMAICILYCISKLFLGR